MVVTRLHTSVKENTNLYEYGFPQDECRLEYIYEAIRDEGTGSSIWLEGRGMICFEHEFEEYDPGTISEE